MLCSSATFSKLTYWNHDTGPAASDGQARTLDWLKLAEKVGRWAGAAGACVQASVIDPWVLANYAQSLHTLCVPVCFGAHARVRRMHLSFSHAAWVHVGT